VTLDVEGKVEFKTILKQERIDYLPSMENQSPLPGFSVQLEGLERGITKTFSVKVPDEYTDETIKGKDCDFIVTVSEIKEKSLPPLDDEFAKGIGEGFDSLGGLRADILERLNKNMDLQMQEEFNGQALQKVVDGSLVTIPELIIKREVDNMIGDQQRALKSRNIDLDSYLSHIGKSEDEMKAEMRPAARERIVKNLVLANLSKEFNLEASDSEVESQIKDMFAGADKRSTLRALKSEEVKKSVSTSILNRKSMERLVNLIESNSTGKKTQKPKSKTALKMNIPKK
jgi:trigger factor